MIIFDKIIKTRNIIVPRVARIRDPEAVYHVMCRSISEINLFQDNHDKDYFLKLVKRYKDKFKCKVYSYCLMDNHLHLQLDTQGLDISVFMRSLNTAYVCYFNARHDRHGHLFQGRYVSKVINNDSYMLATSAYIHKNPKDLGFDGREEEYEYSSYGIYTGYREDTYQIVDTIFFEQPSSAVPTTLYREYVARQHNIDNLQYEVARDISETLKNEYLSGRSIINRTVQPSKIISYISDKFIMNSEAAILTKSKRSVIKFRAITAYMLRILCGLTYKEVCANICNMTISGCSRLCDIGYSLLEEPVYEKLFKELVSICTA